MKNLWEKYGKGEEKEKVMNFCEEYKLFLSKCKTERECVAFAIEMAEKKGFQNLADLIEKKKKLKAGDKVYAVNMDKSVMLFVVGEQPIEKGINIVGAHIDSPRLDLKAKPFYESQGFCMIDTHYYGGIKKYQWIAQPLALHGVVFRKDGSKVSICLGEDDDCGSFVITDLLPHLDKDDKKDVKGEDLNLIAGNVPAQEEKENKFKKFVLELLKQFNIEEDDFFSAEIEVVPSGKARDCGLDRSMILGYGHDDRVCAYANLMAMLEVEKPKHSVLSLLVDKEEIGSVGATGMHSKFFENTIAEIMELCGQYTELGLRRALNNSNMISSDVTAGVDPNYVSPYNVETDAHLARGISFNKFTGARGKSGANDANPEFIAQLRDCLDKAEVAYQATEMGKVDQGGGGTIAYIMAKYGMNVIDAGVPVLNMHAPWEVVSKVDVYETYRAYKAFFGMEIKPY
ncbi:MAG: aminopeptidase [Clostridia bacterium]|nr:aminopeptidase [Clostridia bacterium]